MRVKCFPSLHYVIRSTCPLRSVVIQASSLIYGVHTGSYPERFQSMLVEGIYYRFWGGIDRAWGCIQGMRLAESGRDGWMVSRGQQGGESSGCGSGSWLTQSQVFSRRVLDGTGENHAREYVNN